MHTPGTSRTWNRRRLLATGATGLALGGLGFAAAPLVAQEIQIGGTPASAPADPAAPVAANPPAAETVHDVAARLAYDQDAILAFVRNEIAYEAYDGILRGAQGTLSARAGNGADQAVLLGELLQASGMTVRFVTAMLDAAASEALTARLARTPGEAIASLDEAEQAAILYHLDLDELPATPPVLDPRFAETLTRLEDSARIAVDLALDSAQASAAAITTALSNGGITLPPLPAAALPDSERQRHLWVQVADGSTWSDLDSTLPPGAVMPAPTETFANPPDDWYHWVRFVISADEWVGGTVASREVVSLSAASARLVDVPVALSMASAGEIVELGSTVNQVLGGQKTIYPSIYADGVTVNATRPVIFATDAANAQDPFAGTGTSGIGAGEAIAVWLQVEITRPGADQVLIRRPLLDRLLPDDRASGTVVPERIAPVKTVPTGIGDDTLDQFNTLTLIHTDVARMPSTDDAVRYSTDEVFGALGMLGPSLANLRDALGPRIETTAGAWSYPSAPNITVFQMTAPDSGGSLTLAADLLYRDRTSLPLANTTPGSDIHPLVLSGVLDAVAEHLLLAPETRGDTAGSPGFTTGPSVAGLFATAAQSGIRVRLLATTSDLAGLTFDAMTQARLAAILERGDVIVIPEAPVEIGGSPVLGWWIVDPATGRTRDELEDGTAGASTTGRSAPAVLFGNAPGYTFLDRAIAWFVAHRKAFTCLGVLAFWGAFISKAIMRSNSELAAGNPEAAQLYALAGVVGGTTGTAFGVAAFC